MALVAPVKLAREKGLQSHCVWLLMMVSHERYYMYGNDHARRIFTLSLCPEGFSLCAGISAMPRLFFIGIRDQLKASSAP